MVQQDDQLKFKKRFPTSVNLRCKIRTQLGRFAMRREYCGRILGRYSPWRLLSNRLVLAGTDEDIVKIARIALQLPVTQVSVDSVFSSLKYVLNDLRMRFGDHVVDAILVLRANN